MMNMNSTKKLLSVILCVVLIAAMALFAAGCTDSPDPTEAPQIPTTGDQASDLPLTVLGEGETVFTFTVVDPEGTETRYEIHTDETIVGNALQALELLEGEEGPYGLYVKSVTGIPLDYDTDGMYWGFYVNGEYALTGVDTTDIVPGTTYTFQADKG